MMTKDSVVFWLAEYLSVDASSPTDNRLTQNYFELGLIDSFGVIELIEEIETRFNVSFSEAAFQDRRFSTINGLAEIILELFDEKVSQPL